MPAEAIFRDESDEEPAMGMTGSDGSFSDGDAYVPPPKRAKSVSATDLFPATGKARKHPPAVTNVDGNHNDHTPVKSNVDPEKGSDNSPLRANCDSANGRKSFKVKLMQAGALFLPSPTLHTPTNKEKPPLLPPMVNNDGTWVCCSITHTEERQRCANCQRWKTKRPPSKLSTRAKKNQRKKTTANHAPQPSDSVICHLD